MQFVRDLFASIFGTKPVKEEEPGKCPFFHGDLATQEQEPEPEIELSELQKIRKTFNTTTDLIALSKDYYGNLDEQDKEWIDSIGERAIYFEGKTLINVGVVKTGSSYMKNFNTKI